METRGRGFQAGVGTVTTDSPSGSSMWGRGEVRQGGVWAQRNDVPQVEREKAEDLCARDSCWNNVS